MSSGTKLKDWLRNHTSAGVKVFGSTVASLILAGFEELLEKNIQCPCEKRLNNIYTGIFFGIPFFIMLSVSLVVQLHSGECSKRVKTGSKGVETGFKGVKNGFKHQSQREKCTDCFTSAMCPFLFVLFKTLLPSIMWIVILFLDGDYLACSEFMKSNETVTSETCGEFNCSQNPSKVPSDLRDICSKSRLIGSIILVGTVILPALVYYLFYCCSKTAPANSADTPAQSGVFELRNPNTEAGKVEDASDKLPPKLECQLLVRW